MEKGNQAGDVLHFCLDRYKNNFPTLSHLAFLQMRPIAVINLFDMLVAPTKERWHLAVLPS